MRNTLAIVTATLLMTGAAQGITGPHPDYARMRPEQAHFAHAQFEPAQSPQPGVETQFCTIDPAGPENCPLPAKALMSRPSATPEATIPGAAVAPGRPALAQTHLTDAADFEAAISQLTLDEPQSPKMLTTRLDYADFLLGEAGPGCEQLAATTQSQLNMAAQMSALVFLPLALGRMANAEYRVHLVRATCNSQAANKTELHQALEMAQQAVLLYQNAFDYPSTVIMQFNVAATHQQLGDAEAALSALQAAIAMDRKYGFRRDAEDNIRLLLQWKGEKAGDSDVAALMKDFPVRTEAFQFNWPNGESDVSVNVDDTSVIGGSDVRSQAALTLKRNVLVDSNTTGTVTRTNGVETADINAKMGWTTVTNELGNSSYEPGIWPPSQQQLEWPTLYFLTSELYEAPAIQINANGDFRTVADPGAFVAGLSTKLLEQITSCLPVSEWDVISDNLRRTLTRRFIEAKAAQDYGLQTATWIGAKLKQGVWYQMSTPLLLPGLGLGRFLVRHNIRFAFTRELPCTSNASDHLCAEIVIHATPDPSDLSDALQEAGVATANRPHVWARMDLRLVVDPNTLLPDICETTQNWYDGVGKKDDPIIETTRTVSTSVYH